MGRLSVFHVISQEEQDVPVLNGRLDADKVRVLLRTWCPPPSSIRSSSAARPA